MKVLSDAFRLLSFRATRDEMLGYGRGHFIFGLLATWLVGIGRYWDHPSASALQYAGIGSLAYIFILALLIWLICAALRPHDWSYFRVLTFLSLVSPPAILYAFPIERFTDIETANIVNFWFLAIVAAWRVALLLFYLSRFAEFGWLQSATATLLPITLIVVLLTALNLENAVFEIMGGIREKTPNDAAYGLLMGITFFSLIASPLLFILYIALIINRSKEPTKKPYESEAPRKD